ncbi:MAG TPA: response regulator [Opitutaceae bacterium]
MQFRRPPRLHLSPDPRPAVPPVVPPAAEAPVPSLVQPEGPARALILVVDDSPLMRGMVTKMLKAKNFAIIQADSGLHGIAEWENRKADIALVVSDVFMPGMDGLAFARELRKRQRTLPIILMSSKLDEDSRWIAEESGFLLLPKPFQESQLLELVERVLRSQRPG